MCLATLFPHLAGLRLRQLVVTPEQLILVVAPKCRTARCPLCLRRSARIHSAYERSLTDLPIGDRPVRLRLHGRRFRCLNPACARRIFAERFPRLAPVHARRTHPQRRALVDFGLALGGSAGARLANRRGVLGSRATVLRGLHALPPPEITTPRVLGIDDWARRRGQTYGTILVDLEQHRPVDLLDDRTAEGLAAWLRAHPGVEIIARDRSGAYAEGARLGAPQAVQVADRFHLLLNLGEALERVLGRKRALLRDAARVVDQSIVPPPDQAGAVASGSAPAFIATTRPPQSEPEPCGCRAQRQECYAAVVTLHRQGFSASHIAREVGIGRKTVSRWLQAGSFPERAPAPRRSSILDPYEPYLRARWAAGCHNARQLWRELQAQGFPGAASLVRRFVARWRPEPGRRGRPARGASPAGAIPAPPTPARMRSPRQARWLLLRPVEELRPDEQVYRRHLLDTDAELRCASGLAEAFGQLVRERQREQLDPWLTHAERSGVPEFREFARVMRRDHAAVAAALSAEWSNGQTEGQITRLKSVKRQMYGRAGFGLLKQRVLATAWGASSRVSKSLFPLGHPAKYVSDTPDHDDHSRQ